MTACENESTLPLDDGGIHVCEDGPRDAPALLLIHGTAVSARSWEAMVPLLAGSHRVIRIDLPGCGGSPAPDGASHAVPENGRRAGAVLDRLGVGRAVVVGHSSGGTVATALAEGRPDLVAGVVLVNTGPDMSAYTGQQVALPAASFADLTDDQLRGALGDAFHPGYEIPRSFLDQARDVDLQVFAATSRAITAYLDERGLPERLAPLGTPLLVIFGEEDRRWRPSSAARYRTVPGARIEMLPGVGHSPILEDPQRTAGPLLAFAAELAG